MSLINYSITLNFFLPLNIIDGLRQVQVTGDLTFDWRRSSLCHCTVKAISLCEEVPPKAILDEWVAASQKILATQKSFRVRIQNVAQFPTALYTHVESPALVSLHQKLCKVLPSSQPQFEDEHYVPHASIGVLKQPVKILSNLVQDFGEFQVNEIQLIIWKLADLNPSTIYHRFNLT